MFEVRWNYLPAPVNDSLSFKDVNTMSDYDSVITSNAYINSLRSGIKGERYKRIALKRTLINQIFFQIFFSLEKIKSQLKSNHFTH